MAKKSNRNNYLKQAGILAAAGIICRIIGILYRSPLTSIIGDEGNGYYTSAYNIYTIILLLSSYSIPSAISKIIASKLALKEYRSAHRIFHCALIYVFVIGGAASLFTFLGAELFLEGEAAVVLKVFSPTIFLSGFAGVLRGYFQAHGSMVQTSFSQIVEQILNAVISIYAAHLLIGMASSKSSTTKAIYGAAGSALGTGSGVVIALLFMLAVYALNRKMLHTRMAKDRHRYIDSYEDILKGMLVTVTPIILSTFIYNFSTSFNQTVYSKVMIYSKGLSVAETATAYGVFAGKAMVIINIPIALAASLSSAMIPTISKSSALGSGEKKGRECDVDDYADCNSCRDGAGCVGETNYAAFVSAKRHIRYGGKAVGNDCCDGYFLFVVNADKWHFAGNRKSESACAECGGCISGSDGSFGCVAYVYGT